MISVQKKGVHYICHHGKSRFSHFQAAESISSLAEVYSSSLLAMAFLFSISAGPYPTFAQVVPSTKVTKIVFCELIDLKEKRNFLYWLIKEIWSHTESVLDNVYFLMYSLEGPRNGYDHRKDHWGSNALSNDKKRWKIIICSKESFFLNLSKMLISFPPLKLNLCFSWCYKKCSFVLRLLWTPSILVRKLLKAKLLSLDSMYNNKIEEQDWFSRFHEWLEISFIEHFKQDYVKFSSSSQFAK